MRNGLLACLLLAAAGCTQPAPYSLMPAGGGGDGGGGGGGAPPPVCGDLVCDGGETHTSCPSDCPAPPTCDADDLGRALPAESLGTTTGGASEPDTASCGDGAASPTRRYLWTAPMAGRYHVTATASFPIVLDASVGACSNQDDACAALPPPAAGTTPAQATAAIDVSVYGGQTLTLTLAGLGGASGDYILNVAREADACGDGVCSGTETVASCAADCTAAASCGDGVCNADESSASCPSDCGWSGGGGGDSGSYCGDGVCDAGEDCGSCDADCGSCSGDDGGGDDGGGVDTGGGDTGGGDTGGGDCSDGSCDGGGDDCSDGSCDDGGGDDGGDDCSDGSCDDGGDDGGDDCSDDWCTGLFGSAKTPAVHPAHRVTPDGSPR